MEWDSYYPPAFADFYVIQDVTTDRCRIVGERPAPNVGIVIDSPFELRAEAENHMRTVEACHEGTTGGARDYVRPRRSGASL